MMEQIILILATGCKYSEEYRREQNKLIQFYPFPLAFLYCSIISCFSFPAPLFVAAALCIAVASIAGMAEKILDSADSDSIIIDRCIGLCTAFIYIPLPTNPFYLFLFFIVGSTLFLLAERVQPFPVKWIKTHLNGGFAIILDDIVAGGYVCIFLHVIWRFFFCENPL